MSRMVAGEKLGKGARDGRKSEGRERGTGSFVVLVSVVERQSSFPRAARLLSARLAWKPVT